MGTRRETIVISRSAAKTHPSAPYQKGITTTALFAVQQDAECIELAHSKVIVLMRKQCASLEQNCTMF